MTTAYTRSRLTGCAAALLFILLSACSPDSHEVILVQPSSGITTAASIQWRGHRETQPRFAVVIEAPRELRLGTKAVFIVRVNGLASTAAASLRVLLPEVEASKRPEFSVEGYPVSIALQPALQVEFGLGRGAERSYPAPLSFDAPGYYRISAFVSAATSEPQVIDGKVHLQSAAGELWVWVDETSSRITPVFDSSVFPDTVAPIVGPRVFKSSAGATQAALRSPVLKDSHDPNCDEYTLKYFNSQTQLFAPVPLATSWGNVVEDISGNPVSSYFASTDQNGVMQICGIPEGLSYSGQMYFVNNSVNLESQPTSVWISGGATDGDHIELVTPNSAGARIFIEFNDMLPKSWAKFNISGPTTAVRIEGCPDDPTVSCFGIQQNLRIFINPNHVWQGEFTISTVAHEYGHRLHWDWQNGFVTPVCTGHTIFSPISLGCAMVEGWADFHAGFVQADRLSADQGSDSKLEVNPYWGALSSDGSIIEGAVAAFLFDLVDDASTTDNIPGPDDDTVQYPTSYIKGVLSTCKWLNGVNAFKADGIDHLIYCFERAVDPAITGSPTYFPTRNPDPSGYQENAVEPGSWNQASIRALWKRNLYGQ